MKRPIVAVAVLAAMSATAFGDTLQFTFSDTTNSKNTCLWTYTGRNSNNAAINTGAEPTRVLLSGWNQDWYFGYALFQVDMPPVITTGSGVVESAELSMRDTWWGNNGYSNVELRRINSPAPWEVGNGTAALRWSYTTVPSSQQYGASWFYANFDNLAGTGTSWTGAQVDKWSFTPADRLENAVWASDGVTPVLSDLISSGTIAARGGCYLDDWVTLVGGDGWARFDATMAVQKWATGAWQNTGMALYTGNALPLRTSDSNGVFMNTTLNFSTATGGLVITYTTARMGDANKDGLVDMSDYIIWFNNFGATVNTTWTMADFNADGIVDMTDYVTWFSNFGETGPGMSSLASAGPEAPSIPEPMTLALVALAVPLVLRRRRQGLADEAARRKTASGTYSELRPRIRRGH